MFVEVHFLRVDSNKLFDFLIENKIGKFLQEKATVKRCQVFLRKTNADPINNKVVEVKFNTSDRSFFACSEANTFEKAIDESFFMIKRQVRHLEKFN